MTFPPGHKLLVQVLFATLPSPFESSYIIIFDCLPFKTQGPQRVNRIDRNIQRQKEKYREKRKRKIETERERERQIETKRESEKDRDRNRKILTQREKVNKGHKNKSGLCSRNKIKRFDISKGYVPPPFPGRGRVKMRE